MNKQLGIIGAGGHGKVVADIAVQCGYTDIVFYDDNHVGASCAGFPVVGTVENAFHDDSCSYIVAIGNATMRQTIQEKLKNVVTLLHPRAVISRRVMIGEGTVVMAGAVINSDTEVGRGCIINTGATVDHDNKIGDFTHISVGAHLAGTVIIGNKSWIGVGATISNNIEICENCMIGAGAVVVKNIESSGVYVGVPAKRNNKVQT